ncbi:MAG: hypothetical protein QME71_03145, partial [Dehalococcoidia bacterium]|nr:hypothetical protein [Dehalococcoidia bacterium]
SVEELVPASSEAVVLAIQQATGALLVSPRGSLTIGRGDILIVFGRERDIEVFARHGREKTAGGQVRPPLPKTTPPEPV